MCSSLTDSRHFLDGKVTSHPLATSFQNHQMMKSEVSQEPLEQPEPTGTPPCAQAGALRAAARPRSCHPPAACFPVVVHPPQNIEGDTQQGPRSQWPRGTPPLLMRGGDSSQRQSQAQWDMWPDCFQEGTPHTVLCSGHAVP